MQQTIFIILAMIIYVIGVCYFATKYFVEKSKVAEIEKQFTGNLTDFEKLQLIAKIYLNTNLSKVSQENLRDWKRFVNKMK